MLSFINYCQAVLCTFFSIFGKKYFFQTIGKIDENMNCGRFDGLGIGRYQRVRYQPGVLF